MRNLVSLDPGKHFCGFAVWDETKTLLAAGYVENEFVCEFVLIDGNTWIDVAIEIPRIYPLARSKGGIAGQNACIDVAFAAGKVVGWLDPQELYRYAPHDWKGTVPKKIKNARDWKLLTKEEAARVNLTGNKKLDTNILDAVGVGLFHLKRRAK